MLSQVCGLEPGTIDWSIKDAHIYVNQVDGIKLINQILRHLKLINNVTIGSAYSVGIFPAEILMYGWS